MATVQTDFYNQNPLRSPLEYQALVDRNRLSDQAVQANALAFKDRERALQESTALRNALAMGVDPRTPEGQSKLMQVAPNAAGPVIKSLVDAAHVAGQTTREEATRKKTEVETQNLTWEQKVKQANKAIADISALSSADEARQGISNQVKAGVLDMQKATALLQSIPEDPAQFGAWQRKMLLGIMDAKERLAATKPNIAFERAGGSIVPVQTNPDAGPVGAGAMPSIPITQSEDNKATNARMAADAAADRKLKAEEGEKDRKAKKETEEAGKYTQVVIDPDRGPIVVDKKTNTFTEVTGKGGEKIPGKNVTAAKDLESKLGVSIKMARELIPKATGSGAGSLVDTATRFVGASTEGDDAASQLETLAGWMTSNVPRMQGPQSDKDTLLYKQMAAQVGDRTKTRSARMEALNTLERLQKQYAILGDKGVVKIQNDADYEALKSGTRFITPDGKTGTKR